MGLRTTGDLRRLLAKVQAEQQRRAEQRERFDLDKNAAAIRERCRTLIGFVREAWHVLEPRTQFVEGWVTRAICQHLEAITHGTFMAMGAPNRLRMNVPPGFSKSICVSVLWNAWEWGPANLAHHRFLSTSYSENWVRRDTRKTRDLILSAWYQRLWGKDAEGEFHNRVVLTRFGETSFENAAKGTREGVPFDRLTGGRGDVLTIDDPVSVVQANSDADREHARFIMRERVPMSINDPVRSAIGLIMQRVHKQDPSGLWEELGIPHVALVLPMRFIAAKRCITPIFSDPRQVEGELLFPERFPPAVVDALEKEMTPYAVSGQHQQEPTPRGGGMFKLPWFLKRVRVPPSGLRWVRHFDLADTEEIFSQSNSARTAGVLLGSAWPKTDGKIYIANCRAERIENAEPWILTICAADRIWCARHFGRYEVSLPQDPGQAGKVQKRGLGTALAGYDVHFTPETGDKPTRATPFASQAEIGNVIIVEGETPEEGAWIMPYLDELCQFPAKPNDRGDATSGAYARLLKAPRTMQDDTGSPASLPIFQR
jgi:predicted phage terminase large subunit-like protein